MTKCRLREQGRISQFLEAVKKTEQLQKEEQERKIITKYIESQKELLVPVKLKMASEWKRLKVDEWEKIFPLFPKETTRPNNLGKLDFYQLNLGNEDYYTTYVTVKIVRTPEGKRSLKEFPDTDRSKKVAQDLIRKNKKELEKLHRRMAKHRKKEKLALQKLDKKSSLTVEEMAYYSKIQALVLEINHSALRNIHLKIKKFLDKCIDDTFLKDEFVISHGYEERKDAKLIGYTFFLNKKEK